MDLQKYIGEKIKRRSEELGLSRYELERRTGISYNQLMNIERGESTSTRLLSKIFEALDLEIFINVKYDYEKNLCK